MQENLFCFATVAAGVTVHRILCPPFLLPEEEEERRGTGHFSLSLSPSNFLLYIRQSRQNTVWHLRQIDRRTDDTDLLALERARVSERARGERAL